MGEYGIAIQNIEAATLYETNVGVRDYFESKRAMLTNSLFLDFLLDNGLQVKKDSTLDIIGMNFNWGTRSYEEEIKKLKKISREAKLSGDSEKRKRVVKLMLKARANKQNFKKLSKEELREEFYKNGVDITYTTRDKKGNIVKTKTIHYKYIFRSVGKAKKGNCMFIRDGLYAKTKRYLSMGIKIPKENAPIVELGAYMPLIASTIIGKVHIDTKELLVVNDFSSFFKTKVVSIETDEEKKCVAKTLEDYTLKNEMWDGQALIDSSIFPDWADGYVLLRQHFCKMAAFNTNIQLFFKDYYGANYETATVQDMFGNEHYVKDIKLITTNNAMKWLKVGVTYDYWCERVEENGCMFGVVKTSHPSKLGNVQRMSYQMVNTLSIDNMDKVVATSVEYINNLKTKDEVFLDYLEKNSNFSNDFDVLVALYKQNPEFGRSEYFRARRKKIIRTYIQNFKSGRVIQDADNLTLVGSPYALLLNVVGEDPESDPTMRYEEGVIQCYTPRFEDNDYMAGFRNPHNSCNNVCYFHNVHSYEMERYFNLGQLCLAVNCVHSDIQDRANGCDFDSDSMYVTNHPIIVAQAQNCYLNYPTIVNNIPKEQNNYNNTMEDYALVDNNLAKSQMSIGESSNLAQIALTYSYNFEDQKYKDYVCILSVIAQAAIDSAKRRFDIDIYDEIKRIKKDMDIATNGYPAFWANIRDIDRSKINHSLKCPMNYLNKIKFKKIPKNEEVIPMEYFFNPQPLEATRKQSKKVEALIEKYAFELYDYNVNAYNENDEYILLRSDFDALIRDISQVYISKSYAGLMSWLLDRAFLISSGTKRNKECITSKTDMNKSLLMKTLYTINPTIFLKIWAKTGTLNFFDTP